MGPSPPKPVICPLKASVFCDVHQSGNDTAFPWRDIWCSARVEAKAHRQSRSGQGAVRMADKGAGLLVVSKRRCYGIGMRKKTRDSTKFASPLAVKFIIY
jgi:hypothetical protein